MRYYNVSYYYKTYSNAPIDLKMTWNGTEQRWLRRANDDPFNMWAEIVWKNSYQAKLMMMDRVTVPHSPSATCTHILYQALRRK